MDLKRSDSKVGTVTMRATGQAAGRIVLEQSPPSNATAGRGSSVDLVVEAEKIAVPTVVGKTLPDAEASLRAAGLRVGQTTTDGIGMEASQLGRDTIAQQTPAAGQRV